MGEEPVFRAKNVTPDFLELRVPVWVSDIAFINSQTVATCSRHGHIRLYDTRSSSSRRRPVSQLTWTEKGEDLALTAIAATQDTNQVLVGSAQGKVGLWDFRKGVGDKGLFRKYNGCVGSVRDIATAGPYFCTVGLDRFLRVFAVGTKRPVDKMYLKSRLNCALMVSDFDPEKVVKEEEEEEKVDNGEDSDIEIIEDEDDNDNEAFWNNMEEIKEKPKRKCGGGENVPIKKRK